MTLKNALNKQFSKSFFLKTTIGLICGEYRSRTDDLLRARQAL